MNKQEEIYMTKQKANELREAKNVVTMEGLLLEKEVNHGTTDGGKEYLRVRLVIGTAENEQHEVNLFQNKLTRDGKENGLYDGLLTVANDYKAVADVGKEEADRVRIEPPTNDRFNNGVIQMNDYVGQDGVLRSFPRLSATFVNRIDKGEEMNPHAKFETEAVVNNVTEEIVNDEETGRAKLSAYIPLYGGRVIPFEYVVNEDGADYVLDNYEKGDTVFVYGNITNVREVKETVTQGAFGADNKSVTYNYIREYEIIGGTDPYDEDDNKAYDVELIKKALVERETYLEGLKEKHKSKKSSSGARKGGFDTSKPKTNNKYNEDDLPF